jgi:hypothetical protein
MTTLDVDVADVETVARPAARSSDTKAATAYLIASGATAITIIENVTGCAYRIGTKLDPRAASVAGGQGAAGDAEGAQARGKAPGHRHRDGSADQAASDLKVTLTEHATAMMRAGEAAKRLDAFIAQLRARGAMREFTKMFKRRRLAAGLRGEDFMSYAVAELRLRRALVPLLQGGGNVHTATLFADVFGS